MMIAAIVVGLALLFFGRRLFWLFVGGAGFAAGMELATNWFQGQSEGTVLLIAIIAGVVGALLAILLQKFAIGLAGFFTGGYALMNLASRLGYHDWAWIAFLVGGLIGAALVLVLFDWALIVLSAVTGALLVVDGLRIESSLALIAFVVLLLAGIVSQWLQLGRQTAVAEAPPPPAV